MAGVYHTDDLPSPDQAIPASLVYDSISGKAKSVIKSWSGDIGLSKSNSIGGLLSSLLTK